MNHVYNHNYFDWFNNLIYSLSKNKQIQKWHYLQTTSPSKTAYYMVHSKSAVKCSVLCCIILQLVYFSLPGAATVDSGGDKQSLPTVNWSSD